MGSFEKFTGGPNKPREHRVHITLSPRNVIYLNRNARRLLGDPEAVVLHYDREDARIGIMPAHLQLEEAFPLVIHGTKHIYWKIQASRFCRNYEIRVPTTQAFVRPEVDGAGMLLLDLKTTVRSSRSGLD